MCVLCVMTFLTASGASASALVPQRCPEGMTCHPQGTHVCFTIEQAASIDRTLIDSKYEITKLKLKRLKRFGWTAGCGGMAGYSLEQIDLTTTVTAGCGALWGFRW